MGSRVTKPLAVLAALAAVAASLPSCSRTPAAAAPSSPGAASAASAAPAATPATAAPASSPGPASASPASASSPDAGTAKGIVLAQSQAAPPSAAASRPLPRVSPLLGLGRAAAILPEDFSIGPIGLPAGAAEEARGAYGSARAFLAALVAGKVDAARVSEGSRDTLPETLAFGLRQAPAPRSFRLGSPKTLADGSLAFAVRLFSDAGTAGGEIYMDRAGGEWTVADVQVRLADLAVPRAAPTEAFFPSAYRWLLQE